MAWLALAAALLMAAMPTVGRVLAAADAGARPILMELCTHAGIQLVDVSAFVGDPAPPAGGASAMDPDCAYCVLATPLLAVLAVLLVLLRYPPRSPAARRSLPSPQGWRNLRGLGSQGPPVAL